MAFIGYARVSTEFQNLRMQIDALNRVGCTKVYAEKQSGANDNREQFNACMEYLREGDTLVIYHLDRLARSTLFTHEIKATLDKKGVELVSLNNMVDTSTPEGKFMFTIEAGLAQLQRDQISRNTKIGLQKARELGRYGGRPKAFRDPVKLNMLITLHSQGYTIKSLCEQFKVGSTSVCKYIRYAKATGLYPGTLKS